MPSFLLTYFNASTPTFWTPSDILRQNSGKVPGTMNAGYKALTNNSHVVLLVVAIEIHSFAVHAASNAQY